MTFVPHNGRCCPDDPIATSVSRLPTQSRVRYGPLQSEIMRARRTAVHTPLVTPRANHYRLCYDLCRLEGARARTRSNMDDVAEIAAASQLEAD